MNTPCTYHPNKDAETRCSRCNRPICVSDARLLTQVRRTDTHKTTVGNVETQHYRLNKTQKMLCIPCEAERVLEAKQKMKRTKIALLSVMIILVSYVAFSWLWGMEVFGGMVTYGALVVFSLICCMIQSGEKRAKIVVDKAIREKNEFEQSLSS